MTVAATEGGFGLFASLRRFAKLLAQSLYRERDIDSGFRVGLKRVCVLWVVGTIVPSLIVWNHVGFLLDDFLFPAWRAQQIHAPVFLVGNARSGTTLLHRLLASDTEHFSATALYEILFAQSVTFRRGFFALAALDRRFGSLGAAAVRRLDDALLRRVHVHPVGLLLKEEDEWLMAMSCCCQLLALLFPTIDLFKELIWFDRTLPEVDQQAVFRRYRELCQKHLYAHGSGKTYLSKNPTFTLRLKSLLREFPDARVVVLVRDPRNAIPSMVSYIGKVWHTVAEPIARYPASLALQSMCTQHYEYPLSVLGDSAHYVLYENLRDSMFVTVADLVVRLGFPLPDGSFEQVLRDEARTRYRSTHNYDCLKVCEASSTKAFRERHAASFRAWNRLREKGAGVARESPTEQDLHSGTRVVETTQPLQLAFRVLLLLLSMLILLALFNPFQRDNHWSAEQSL